MSRKPINHEPPETGKTLIDKAVNDSLVSYTPTVATPEKKDDVLSLHHPLYAPSSMDAIALCPARVRMSSGLPSLPKSEDAEEGTLLHKAVATRNFTGLDSEQMELVRKCDAVLVDVSGPCVINREELLFVMGSNYEEITYGTSDIVIPKKDKVVVLDWKFGRNEVEEAANNLQLASYAVGAAQKYGVDAVECHVFQPRINHHSVYTFTDIPAVLAAIEDIIEATQEKEWVFNPCEKACQYCKAKFTCGPCLKSLALNLPAVAEGAEQDQAALAVRMPDLIKAAKQAAKLAESILSKAKDMITQGITVPGYYLKDGNNVRYVHDIPGLYAAVSDKIPYEKFLSICSCPTGETEEAFIQALKVTNPEITIKEAKAKFEEVSHLYVGTKQNKPSLAEVKVKK